MKLSYCILVDGPHTKRTLIANCLKCKRRMRRQMSDDSSVMTLFCHLSLFIDFNFLNVQIEIIVFEICSVPLNFREILQAASHQPHNE